MRKLFVSPNCRGLIRALSGGYLFRRVLARWGDHYNDEPEKNEWSHVAEACQYMLMGGGALNTIMGGWTEAMTEIENEPDFDGWRPRNPTSNRKQQTEAYSRPWLPPNYLQTKSL